jgi:hypothetical protein
MKYQEQGPCYFRVVQLKRDLASRDSQLILLAGQFRIAGGSHRQVRYLLFLADPGVVGG